MPNSIANPTPITPPRVPFIDARTGLIDRAWYMFFLSLFTVAQGSDDLKKAPDVSSLLASYDAALQALAQATETVPASGVAELQTAVESVQQELQTLPRQELGTLAQLQQDNVPWLQFDTTPAGMPTGVNANGTLYWDNADSVKTLNIVMEDSGEVVQQIGEETYYRVKATAPITKGQVIMFTGTVGASGGLLGAPATGLTATQSEYIMGVATQDIATNGWGYVIWFGEVKKVNTTGGAEVWADGDILYYNPTVAGGLTKFVPTAPNPKVIVASVVHAATNGILFVRPTFGSALGQTDSNVEISGLANNDMLVYDSVQSRWENKAPSDTRDALGLGAGTPSNGQLLIGNGTDFTTANLTAGTNITITNGPGSVTIDAASAPNPFGASTASGTNVATFSGTLPAGTATSTNTWTKITISGVDYWLPMWAV